MSLLALTLLASATARPVTAATLPACRTVIVPRQTGEIVDEADTKIVRCQSVAAPQRLRFDVRRRAVVATEALAEGDELGLVYFPPQPRVRSGDRVQILARVGHIAITREATALQNARNGQHFFARGDDGTVFVAPRVAQGTNR